MQVPDPQRPDTKCRPRVWILTPIFFPVLPKDRINDDRYIFNMIDHYSKFLWSRAFSTKEAQPIADTFLEIIQQEGICDVACSDNGTEFRNQIMKRVLEENHISEAHGLPGNPSAQGVVERVNRTVKTKVQSKYRIYTKLTELQIMNMMMADHNRNWSSAGYLGKAVEAYNNEWHRSLKMTPFEAFRYRKNINFTSKISHAAGLPQVLSEQSSLLDSIEIHKQVMEQQQSIADEMIDHSLADMDGQFEALRPDQRVYVAPRRNKVKKSFQMVARVVAQVGKSNYRIQWITHGNNVGDKPGNISHYRHRYICMV